MSRSTSSEVKYVFGGDSNELTRLLEQATDLQPETDLLLDALGDLQGGTAIDIGCGPIGILDLLSQRVGPSGRVVGLEREPRFVAMAEATIKARDLRNVSIVKGDALRSGVEPGSFDLVHERLVLINLPPESQQQLVAEMTTLARPGGIVATESWDRASLVCHPTHPSWDLMDTAYRDAVRATNGDGTTGRALPSLLRSAGLSEVRAKVHVRAADIGDRRRTHRLRILEVAKPRILALGRFTETEFDQHQRALADHLADPNTLLIDQLFIQAWGRKLAS